MVTRDRVDVLVNSASQMLNVTHSERRGTADGSGVSTVADPGTSLATFPTNYGGK